MVSSIMVTKKKASVYVRVTELWNAIAEFEKGEIKNESNNPLLASARAGARMEAYVILFERGLDKLL